MYLLGKALLPEPFWLSAVIVRAGESGKVIDFIMLGKGITVADSQCRAAAFTEVYGGEQSKPTLDEVTDYRTLGLMHQVCLCRKLPPTSATPAPGLT